MYCVSLLNPTTLHLTGLWLDLIEPEIILLSYHNNLLEVQQIIAIETLQLETS